MFREIGCDYCFWTIHFRCNVLIFSISFHMFTPRNRQSIPSGQSKKLQMSINTDHDQVRSCDENATCVRCEASTPTWCVSSRTGGRSARGGNPCISASERSEQLELA